MSHHERITNLPYAAVALAVVKELAPPSQVVRVGLDTKKGVVQGVSSLGTGGSTCSSSSASKSSLLMLLNCAPVQPDTSCIAMSALSHTHRYCAAMQWIMHTLWCHVAVQDDC